MIMNIGIFDSGRGGELVAERLQHLLPEHNYRTVDDRANLPYGNRTIDQVRQLTDRAIQPLLGSDAIVIACNTATTAAIDWLRLAYPGQVFIGFEPMIKPAASVSRSGRATILATAATRQSDRYRHLKQDYASRLIIDEPDTTDWASLIETDRAADIDLSAVGRSVADGSDVIALACTHYLALQDRLSQLSPSVQIIEPTPAVAERISQLLRSAPRQ